VSVRGLSTLTLALLASPLAAQSEPVGLTDARLEAVAGTTPVQAIARFGSGGEAVWIGWSIATVAGAGHVCCGWHDGRQNGCSLADDHEGWSTSDRDRPPAGRSLFVLAEARSGRVQRLRVFSPGCAIDGAGRRVVWLGEVAAGPSLDLLEPLLDTEDERDVDERALAAVASHADPRADRILERRALDPKLDHDDREQALFWAGNLRGETGYRLLDRVLASEPDGELREHALFALTQSSYPGAIDRLKRAAVDDRDSEVRSQGLFWLAQADQPGVGEWILARMAAEGDEEVREQAVFALSQLDDGADWLLRVLRTNRDPEVVRQALFWLGQSDDPRALAELEKILAR